jgi:predicted Rossmann fold flavoprotein
VNRIVVIGGGSAGMVAAIAAARDGARVVILERMERVGRKLLATGNGRCNLTNADLDLRRYHGGDRLFVGTVLGSFGLDDTLAFFAGLGIEPVVEEAGKVFPRSGQASSVLDVLRHELARLGVEAFTGAAVDRIAPTREGWTVGAGEREFRADRVILAAGGRAAPNLGSNGSGFALARSVGHRVVDPFPALTRIRVAGAFLKRLKGVKVDASAMLGDGGECLRREAGEVLFTDTGVSGPPILQLSRIVGERSAARLQTDLSLDLAPEIDPAALEERLAKRFARPGMSAEFALVGFINKRLVPVVLAEAGIQPVTGPASGVGRDGVRNLVRMLKGWRMPVAGTDSWMEAQVTAGGVDTSQVAPETMASLLAPGLHLAGEVLDVDGDCGGFNLQWAWSSGFLAGRAAAR